MVELQRPSRWSSPLTWLVVCVGVFAIVALIANSLQEPRSHSPSWRAGCKNNLVAIGTALHQYHDEYGSFPPAYIADETGKPTHSWRVLLLPFLDMEPLYKEYRFDEPWDGPNNIKLLDQYPEVFWCLHEFEQNGTLRTTSYVAVVGDETIWPNRQSTRLDDIVSKDGSTFTIMVVELADSTILWTEPRDLMFDDLRFNFDKGREISSQHTGGAHVVFVDGRVSYISDEIAPSTLRALLTIDGGETINEF